MAGFAWSGADPPGLARLLEVERLQRRLFELDHERYELLHERYRLLRRVGVNAEKPMPPTPDAARSAALRRKLVQQATRRPAQAGTIRRALGEIIAIR